MEKKIKLELSYYEVAAIADALGMATAYYQEGKGAEYDKAVEMAVEYEMKVTKAIEQGMGGGYEFLRGAFRWWESRYNKGFLKIAHLWTRLEMGLGKKEVA